MGSLAEEVAAAVEASWPGMEDKVLRCLVVEVLVDLVLNAVVDEISDVRRIYIPVELRRRIDSEVLLRECGGEGNLTEMLQRVVSESLMCTVEIDLGCRDGV